MNEMHKYVICNQADGVIFEKQCQALEKNIPDLSAEDAYEDVDGTKVRKYNHPAGNVVVRNDVQVDVLLVEADFDLTPYFKNA